MTATNSARSDRSASGYIGYLLLVVSAVAFSTAGAFARETGVGPWAMVVWRNLFGCAALIPLLIVTRSRTGRVLGPWGWATIAASASASVCYLAAFAYTSVADVAIIFATAPLLTALIARVWWGERTARRTMLASVVAFGGVALTLVGSLNGGTACGDALALAMTLAMALATLFARRHPALPVLPAAAWSALLAALAALPLGRAAGDGFAVTITQAAWLAGFGITTMAVALPAYLIGIRTVPAARAMLIGALDMPLAPLWVWLAFGETPPAVTLAGGALVGAAIIADLAVRP